MDEWLLGGLKSELVKSDVKRRVWTEVKLLWEIDFFSMLTRVSAFGILLMSHSFLDGLGEFDISAFCLLQIALLRFIHGTLIGMSSATKPTSLSEKALARDSHEKGRISLNRSRKCDAFTAAMTLSFFIFVAVFHGLLGEQDGRTALVKKIYLSCVPFLYYLVFNQITIQMFIQPQYPNCKTVTFVWLSTMSFAFHNLSSWLFVHRLEWGKAGSLLAMNIGILASVVGQILCAVGGLFPVGASDNGALARLDDSTSHEFDIWNFIKLLVSSGIMLCSDLWYNSNILLFIAGYMKDVTVASISAFSICVKICTWELMICLGFLSFACVRVSDGLARGNVKVAKFSIKVILCISLLVGLLFSILCLVFGPNIIPYFFSAEDEVANAVSDLSLLLAFSILLKSVYPAFSGVAIGAGLQGTVAIVNICCYYGIGIPLGAFLAFFAQLQIKGLWIGMLCGEITQLLILICILWKIDLQL